MPLPVAHLGPFSFSPPCNPNHLSKMEAGPTPLITQKQNFYGSHSPEPGIQSPPGLSPAPWPPGLSPPWSSALALCPAAVTCALPQTPALGGPFVHSAVEPASTTFPARFQELAGQVLGNQTEKDAPTHPDQAYNRVEKTINKECKYLIVIPAVRGNQTG